MSGRAKDLLFVGRVHLPSSIGDSNEEALAMHFNEWRKSDLKRAELSHLPMTNQHDDNKGVGKVLVGHNTQRGSKLITGVIACDTDAGCITAADIESGKLKFLSLSHDYKEDQDPSTRTINQKRTPIRVGITHLPGRPGCDILSSSLQRVDRETWDPNCDWPHIRPTVQPKSRTEQERDSRTEQEADTMSTSTPMSLPPAEVLQRMAKGDLGNQDVDLLKEAVQALASKQLKHEAEVAHMTQENKEMAQKVASRDGVTKERLEEALRKAVALEASMNRLRTPAAEPKGEKKEGDEEQGEDEDSEMKEDDTEAQGHNAAEQHSSFIGTLSPEQMVDYNRVLEVKCHNSSANHAYMERLQGENTRLREQTQREFDAQHKGMSNAADLYGSAHTPAGVNTGALADPGSRYVDPSDRPAKRSRPEGEPESAASTADGTARSKWEDW